MKAFDHLANYFEALAAQDQFSGVVLITRGGERVFSGAYGYASRAWGVRPSLATRFDTASTTKLFTAVGIFQLIDDHRLSLETRVIECLELAGTTISPDVTVYHLLTHTAGIADDAEEEAGERYEDLWITKPNYAVTQTADFLPQFAHKPPNFAPGQGCRYCNVGYILLGLLIEKVTGRAYRDYVREHIFAPAGMADSAFLHQGEVNENVAEGSDPIRDEAGQIVGWKKNHYAFPPIGSPDSGAYVTAPDLERFLRALRGGALLSPASTEAFFTPQVHYKQHDGWTEMYGFGLWFRLEGAGQVVFCQKEGTNTGVSAVLRYYPAEDVCVVILANMEDAAWAPARRAHAAIVNP